MTLRTTAPRVDTPVVDGLEDTGPKVAPLLTRSALIGFFATLVAVMVWSTVAITNLTHDMNVSWWLAWIPAVATDGAMLVATGWATNYRLDRAIRYWSTGIAATGAIGSVAVAAIEHYVAAAGITPRPELGALIGGIPSLMAVLLIHVFKMICAQQRREQDELEAALIDLTTARGVRAAAEAEVTEAERVRREGYDRALKEDAEHRQKKHDAVMEDTRRTQQELRRVEVEAATQMQQQLRHELDEVAALRATLAAEQQAADAERTAIAETLQQAEGERNAAGEALCEARADRDAANAERREAERIRAKARRQQRRTTDVPVSQPSSRPDATVSQLSSHAASRAQRIEWALDQLSLGRDLRPRDIDEEFGEPRNGSAVLRAAKKRFSEEGQQRLVVGGAGGQ